MSDLFSVLAAPDDVVRLRDLAVDTGVLVESIDEVLAPYLAQAEVAEPVVAVDGSKYYIGSVTLSSTGAAYAERHRRSLEFVGQDEFATLSLLEVPMEHHRERFCNWLAARLNKTGSALLSDVRSVRRALVVLREEHEETLERFALLESSIGQFITPERVEKLSLAPTAASVELPASTGDKRARLRQIMPMQALGLAAIELYLDGWIKGCQGKLCIDLMLGSKKKLIYQWETDAKQLVNGNNVFLLERAIMDRERDPVIEVNWVGSHALGLRLSSINPMRELCAVVENSHTLSAPLALRAWAAVPGSRLMSSRGQVSHTGGERQFDERTVEPISFALGTNELRTVKLLYPTDIEMGWSVVEFREPKCDVLVHPLAGHTTVAILRNINVRGLKYLSALVQVENKESKPVDFSLGAIPHKSFLNYPGDLPKRWTTVEPLVFSEVQGTIDLEDEAARFDLYLATRMHGDADATLAWATFKRIEVTI